MRRSKGITIALSVALLSAPVGVRGAPAAEQAGVAEPPVIVDPPGDANGLNGTVIEEGPDTRPASDDRADLLRIWPETTYDAVEERDGDGTLLAVRHVPRALRVNVETLAPARPATGPTLRFRLPVQAQGCYFEMRYFVHGPLSHPEDSPEAPQLTDMPPEGDLVSINPPAGCFGSTVTSPEFRLDSDGNVTWMEFPFDAVAATAAEGVIAPGVEMTANGTPNVWATRGGVAVGGPIDVAHPLPEPYVIGSDVPPDVDCVAAPEHPACDSGDGSDPVPEDKMILPPVLFVSDSGINPYHVDFRLPPDFDPDDHPGYYPEEATRIELTLDADSYEEAIAADEEIWNGFEDGELYAFEGTNIVGAISFRVTRPTVFDRSGHGTKVTSSAVGKRSGSCPECRVVVNGGFGSDEAFAWALEREWIDVISNSFADILIANPTRPTEKLSRAWTSSGRIWFDAAGNGVPPANHFKSHDAPPWVVRVGMGSRPSLLLDFLRGRTFDVLGDEEKQLAVAGSLDEYEISSGTSMASPDVAGHALRLLWEVRVHFDDDTGLRDGVLARTTDPSRIPEEGPLSDGELTARELERLLFATAQQRPYPQNLLPPELSYFWEGFGYFGTRCLGGGCGGAPDADPLELARAVLFDGAQTPEKPWPQWWWEVDQYLRGPYGGTLAPCKTDPITLLTCLQEGDWDAVGDAPGPPPV